MPDHNRGRDGSCLTLWYLTHRKPTQLHYSEWVFCHLPYIYIQFLSHSASFFQTHPVLAMLAKYHTIMWAEAFYSLCNRNLQKMTVYRLHTQPPIKTISSSARVESRNANTWVTNLMTVYFSPRAHSEITLCFVHLHQEIWDLSLK